MIDIRTLHWEKSYFSYGKIIGDCDFIKSHYHRIGLLENLQESPIFDCKIHGFL